MNKKAIIITSVITLSVGSIAFYFAYWRKKDGVSQSDKPMLEAATKIEINTDPMEPVDQSVITTGQGESDADGYQEKDFKSSIIQGIIKF